MKRYILSFSVLSLALVGLMAMSFMSPVASDYHKAFAKQVEGIDGSTKVLREYLGEQGILVVFSCNTCPFVVAWEDRYNDLSNYAEKHGVNMVLVNSNELFRGNEDSMSAMKKHADDMGYKMPYVMDYNHEIADLMNAKTTPHVFLFDNQMDLMYKGAIDDNYKDAGAVTKTYAKDAIKAMVTAGSTIQTPLTKAIGCSIKRMKK